MKEDIVILGLGPGGRDYLTEGAFQILRNTRKVYFRTGKHPLVEQLKQEGIVFKTYDHIYEEGKSFEEIYATIANDIVNEGKLGGVVYAVPGHPLIAETSVKEILKEAKHNQLRVKVLPAVSFLDALLPLIGVDPCEGLQIIDALALDRKKPSPVMGSIIVQVYSRMVASDVKLSLMEIYPDEHRIAIIRGAGVPELEKIEWIPLYELDRLEWIDHLTSIYVPPIEEGYIPKDEFSIDSLLDVMEELRSDEGCPWDKEQTHVSLKKYLIEETYEVLDAIDEGNMYKICEELGDLLLQVIFHAQIAKEYDAFDFKDVAKGIHDKLIRRHPHVFGDAVARTSQEVTLTWDAVKKQEKGEGDPKDSLLAGVPSGLPALQRAEKLQKKAAKVGFDWPDYIGALDKVEEELEELKEEIKNNNKQQIEEETGDLLFAVVNLARLLHVDPEDALRMTNSKFFKRFVHMEQSAEGKCLDIKTLSLNELDKLWEEAKNSQ